jgi:vacuolar-type H+-ATPase subunit H
MDDILQRLMAIEKEAEEKIRNAEAEAEEIGRKARQEEVALRETFEAELAGESAALISQHVADAEAAKQRTLEDAATEIRARQEMLRQGLDAAVSRAVTRLALPESARPAGE